MFLAIIREGANWCQKCSEGVKGVTVMKSKGGSVYSIDYTEESNGKTTIMIFEGLLAIILATMRETMHCDASQ